MLRSNQVRLVGASILVLLACTPSNGAVTVTPKPRLAATQTLSFPILGDFGSLDPAILDARSDAEIAHNLFNGLVRYDNNLEVVPDIAAGLPAIASDGLTYTFKLRKDVTFSNGDKVTSKDVLYSWNRAVAMQGAFASNLSAIAGYDVVSGNRATGAKLESLLENSDPSVTLAGLKALDSETVEVGLSRSAGWFLPAIAQPAATGMIVDQNVLKTDFDNWWTKPETLIGTGAFKMTAHIPDQSVDFAAVPNWWGTPKPTLTSVHLDISADPPSALARYEQGTYDIVGYGSYSPPISDVARIKASPSEKGQLVLQPKNVAYWVSFNMVADARRPAGGPFTLDQGANSHDLRLAFALAVDKTALAKAVCGNITCIPATGGVIPKGLLGYLGDNNDPLGVFDPIQAKRLLLAADPNGDKTKELVYNYEPDNPLNEPTAKYLQSQWHDNLGVAVTIQSVPRPNFIPARLRGSYVLARDGWPADYNSPQNWFDNLWGKAAGCPDATCTSGYDIHAYDTLLAKADAEPLSSALSDYLQLSRQLISDTAYVPLYYAVGVFLFKPYVRGAGANNLFDYYWNQIQILSH